MANQFVNLPVPTGNGAGAPVDVSSFGPLKTVIVGGDADSVINVEFNNDAGQLGTWHTFMTFQPRGQQTNSVCALWMRVRQSGYNVNAGGTPTVNMGGTDAGCNFANLPVTPGEGNGAAVNVSTLGNFMTVQVSDIFKGTVTVEVSDDGASEWSQPFSFNSAGAQTLQIVAQYMRVKRTGIIGQNPGLPVVNVGGASVADGGNTTSDAFITIRPFDPAGPQGNTYTDWAE